MQSIGDALLRAASSLTSTDPFIAEAGFDSEVVMNVVVLMDAKLDPDMSSTQFPAARSFLPPLDALTPRDACVALDRAAQALATLLRGSSLPQSIMTLAWSHPDSMRALAAAASAPTDLLVFASAGAGGGASADGARASGAALRAPPRVLAASLLAGITLLLKLAGVAHETIVRAEVLDVDEEDFLRSTFGVDLLHGTGVCAAAAYCARVEASLRGGFKKSASDAPVDSAWALAPVTADLLVAPLDADDDALRASAASLDSPSSLAIAQRLFFFRMLLCMWDVFSARRALPPTPPFRWGVRYDLAAAEAAACAAHSALASYAETSVLADAAVDALDSPPTTARAGCSVPALESFYLVSLRPRLVPMLPWAAAARELSLVCTGATFIASFPALVSYDATEPMPHRAKKGAKTREDARALTAGSALASGSPLVNVPFSGLVDAPLTWPLLQPPGIALDAQPSTLHSTPRPRVSLGALFSLLEDFSETDACALVRSWLSSAVLSQPTNAAAAAAAADVAAVTGVPIAASETEKVGGIVSHSLSAHHATSPVVLGSHTLAELVTAELSRTAALPADLVWSREGRAFTATACLVWVNCITGLVVARSRIGKRVKFSLRDWSYLVDEANVLDSKYLMYATERLAALNDAAERGAGGPLAGLDDSDTDGATAPGRAKAAGKKGKPKGRAAAAVTADAFAPAPVAAPPSDAFYGASEGFNADHYPIVFLRSHVVLHRSIVWAMGWACRFQALWLRAAWRDELFARAEWAAATLQEEHIISNLSQALDLAAMARDLMRSVMDAPGDLQQAHGGGGAVPAALTAEAAAFCATPGSDGHPLMRDHWRADASAPPPNDDAVAIMRANMDMWTSIEAKRSSGIKLRRIAESQRSMDVAITRTRINLLRGNIRVLASARILGLWRGLESEVTDREGSGIAEEETTTPAIADAGDAASSISAREAALIVPANDGVAPSRQLNFFRDPSKVYERRFVELSTFAMPPPLTWDAYTRAVHIDPAQARHSFSKLCDDGAGLFASAASSATAFLAAHKAATSSGALWTLPPPPPPAEALEAAALLATAVEADKIAKRVGGSRAAAAAAAAASAANDAQTAAAAYAAASAVPPPLPSALSLLFSARMAVAVRSLQRAAVTNGIAARQLRSCEAGELLALESDAELFVARTKLAASKGLVVTATPPSADTLGAAASAAKAATPLALTADAAAARATDSPGLRPQLVFSVKRGGEPALSEE